MIRQEEKRLERITSTGNKLIREVRDLERKARARRDSGLFVAEGERLCREIPADYIERIFVAEDYAGALPSFREVSDGKRATKMFQVPRELMEHMADTKNSQGILAVVRQKTYTELPGDFFLILDTLQDPGNMGTIFRTAEAAVVDGILMNTGCVDVYSPKVVRATMGAMFRMPFLVSENLPKEMLRMKERGVKLYAAHLKGTENHWGFDYREPTAFMIGNEGNGLQEDIASLADHYLRIPMMGQTESLNAGVAASVLMYEALRQRMS